MSTVITIDDTPEDDEQQEDQGGLEMGAAHQVPPDGTDDGSDGGRGPPQGTPGEGSSCVVCMDVIGETGPHRATCLKYEILIASWLDVTGQTLISPSFAADAGTYLVKAV